MLQSGKSRTIKHFHYMMWPDFGVPSSPTTFLKFLEDVMECGTLNDGSSPPVIHCRLVLEIKKNFLLQSCVE